MLSNMMRYLVFRLRRSWYGPLCLAFYTVVAVTLAGSAERNLRGYRIETSPETWHTDCLSLYGGVLMFGLIIASLFAAWVFLNDFQEGYSKNLLVSRRARMSYAALMVLTAAVVALATVAWGAVVTEAVFLVCPSWLDRPDAAVCLAWMGQAFLSAMLCLCVVELLACLVRSFTVGMVCALLVPFVPMLGFAMNVVPVPSEMPAWLASLLPPANVALLVNGEVPGLPWTFAALGGIVLASAGIALAMHRKRLA